MSGREDDDSDVSEEFTAEQMNDFDTSYEDVTNIFDIGGSKGLSRYMVAKIPITKIIKEDTVNPYEERLSCSVCLIVYSFFGEQLGPIPLRETSPPASPNWKKEETEQLLEMLNNFVVCPHCPRKAPKFTSTAQLKEL